MAHHWNMAINRSCTTATWSISPMTASPITGAAAPVSGSPRMPAHAMSRTGADTSRPIATGTNTTGTPIQPIATRAGPKFRPDRSLVRRLRPMAVMVPRVIVIATAILQGQPADRAPIGRTAPVQPAAPGHLRTDVAPPRPIGTLTAISPDRRRVAAVHGKTARIRSAIAARRRILASLFRVKGRTMSIQADPSVVPTRSGMDDSVRTTAPWEGAILGLQPRRHAPTVKRATGPRRDRIAHRGATPGGRETRTCAVQTLDGYVERKTISRKTDQFSRLKASTGRNVSICAAVASLPRSRPGIREQGFMTPAVPPCARFLSARQAWAVPSPPIRAYAVRKARPDEKSTFASPADRGCPALRPGA